VAQSRLGQQDPKSFGKMMWVLIVVVISIAAIRGDITLAWFGIGA
jgi:flagellar basal body-associated protein FliL